MPWTENATPAGHSSRCRAVDDETGARCARMSTLEHRHVTARDVLAFDVMVDGATRICAGRPQPVGGSVDSTPTSPPPPESVPDAPVVPDATPDAPTPPPGHVPDAIPTTTVTRRPFDPDAARRRAAQALF